ncbi:MAG: class I SAM-dependent methyltransferase [Polyangia bacterium]
MPFARALRKLLVHPAARDLDLASTEATEVHARLIREKPFLRGLYLRYYREFERAHAAAPAGLRLEIGSGGGFLHERILNLASVDLRPGARVDLLASALRLPLADSSAGAVFALNVMHHLPDAELFCGELRRVLAPGGRCVLIEPFVSPFSRRVYRHLHHEPFDPEQTGWSADVDGPMDGANGAIPWVVFVRDRRRFERLLPELEIARVEPHTVLGYLLSGGVSMRALAPAAALAPLLAVEERLGPLMRLAGTMMTVELIRRS